MTHADPLHYYLTQGSGHSNYKKTCRGQNCLVEPEVFKKNVPQGTQLHGTWSDP
jgi:hypothetical protein